MTSSSDDQPGIAAVPPGRSSRSARILGGGTEPDPRFTLANERTFLAWIRTALALLAGGVAVEAFTTDTFASPVRTGLAVVLLLLAMVLAVAAGLRWLAVERAMRRQAPLPLSILVPVLAGGGALVAAAFLVVVLGNA
ncbi:putative membrane protein [Arthrobacter sp. CAN_A2]|uniref:YidH family protein n=1 Tax=Arthrobacter sp. CAN_A2 TaxID=2787718 RepID=UPI001A2F944F